MGSLLREVDKLLRGTFTQKEDLRAGRVGGQVGTLIVAGLILGALYGVFMGLYAVLRTKSPSGEQMLATVVKIPLLFLLTLVVTFPSLYVFSALANSRIRFIETSKLLLMGIVVNLALLASFGPVTGFFTLSTETYSFMVLLNVLFFAIAGAAGLVFIRKALDIVFEEADEPAEGGARKGSQNAGGVRAGGESEVRARLVFWIWFVMYSLVGAQMGWILRPFIGSPDIDFQWFRPRESSFFESVIRHIGKLFS